MKALTKKLFGVLTIAMLSVGSVSLFGEDDKDEVNVENFYFGAVSNNYKIKRSNAYHIRVIVNNDEVANSRFLIPGAAYSYDKGENKEPSKVIIQPYYFPENSSIGSKDTKGSKTFNADIIQQILDKTLDDKVLSFEEDNKLFKITLKRGTTTTGFGFGTTYYVAGFTLDVEDAAPGGGGDDSGVGGDGQGDTVFEPFYYGAADESWTNNWNYHIRLKVDGNVVANSIASRTGSSYAYNKDKRDSPSAVEVEVFYLDGTGRVGEKGKVTFLSNEVKRALENNADIPPKFVPSTEKKFTVTLKKDVTKDYGFFGEESPVAAFTLKVEDLASGGNNDSGAEGNGQAGGKNDSGDDGSGGTSKDEGSGDAGSEMGGEGMVEEVYVYVNKDPKLVTGTGHKVRLEVVEGVGFASGKSKFEGGEVFNYVGKVSGQYIEVNVYFGRKLLDTVSFMSDSDGAQSTVASGEYNDKPIKILIEKEVDSLNNEILIRATEVRIREFGEAF